MLESLFNKVLTFRLATLLKRHSLQCKCFPVQLAKFLRTMFFTEHLRWLLLNIKSCLDLFLGTFSFFRLSKYANFIRASLMFLQLTVEIKKKNLKLSRKPSLRFFIFSPRESLHLGGGEGERGWGLVEKGFRKIPKTLRKTFILAHILKISEHSSLCGLVPFLWICSDFFFEILHAARSSRKEITQYFHTH